MENKNSVYIKYLIDKNVGPLTDVRIEFPFSSNGNPKPVILVGENGTGKSTIISNIVDAFFEIDAEIHSDTRPLIKNRSNQYFKIISPFEIHHGASFMYSSISFKVEDFLHYVFKCGNISFDDFVEQTGYCTSAKPWEDKDVKKVDIYEVTKYDIWKNNVFCYFGPERYEKPVWMGNQYYQTNGFPSSSANDYRDNMPQNPIIVQNTVAENLQWLLDVIADSHGDFAAMDLTQVPEADLDHMINGVHLFSHARDNINTILSNIVGENVYFYLTNRSIVRNHRLVILRKKSNTVFCSSLDSLSTGQIAVFNLFATIARYADNNNILKGSFLDEITGIVVIDEIELHLHPKMQKEVLPKLIKLFPKVQFIITSHSPLFLLGMRDTFGEDGFEVYEMPNAEKISVEKFTEFQNAYEYLKSTETYQQEFREALEAFQSDGKAVIVTEGPTDWKHLKAAYENLRTNAAYQDLFDNLEFEFFKFESDENAEEAEHKQQMGNKSLCSLCKSTAILPHPVKYIFIADRDDETTNEKLSCLGANFKRWGNNVYSFIIPIPPHRTKTPKISIEHYYTDKEIKTEWCDPDTEIARRLFMGNEFDKRGISLDEKMHCGNKGKCGETSIAIIDGSSKERVTKVKDDGINYALPKSKFAEMILEKQAPFDNFNFENFVAIFEIIKEIINDNQEDSQT